jgi:hypothetical protein
VVGFNIGNDLPDVFVLKDESVGMRGGNWWERNTVSKKDGERGRERERDNTKTRKH